MPTRKPVKVKIQDPADDSFICFPVKDPNFDSSAETQDVTTTCSPEGIKQAIAGLISTSANANGFFELQDDGSHHPAQQIAFDAYWKGDKKITIQYFPEGDEMFGYQQEFIMTSWSHSGAIGTKSEVARALQGNGAITFLNEV